MKSLFDAVLEPKREIVLVLGAVVSMDRGLPSWRVLLERLANEIITEPDVLAAFQADPADPTRLAEYLYRELKEDHHEFITRLRRALYEGKSDPEGLLTASIVGYLSQAPQRVRVISTNFDTDVEKSADPNGKAYDLHELEQWQNSASSFDVLHVHGILEPIGERVSDTIVFTEMQFLDHGDEIRRTLTEEFEGRCVILVGVSLTDVNIFGAILKTVDANIFSIVTPDPISGVQWQGVQKYAFMRGVHLKKVKVQPIFVSSYARLAQIFVEFVVGLDSPGQYQSDNRLQSSRFGFRIIREFGTLQSRWFEGRQEGVIDVGLCNALWEELIAANGPLSLLDASDADEEFALFLWLHPYRPQNPPEVGDHLLELVASSQYVHRSRWSVRPHMSGRPATIEVRPSQNWPAATAAFYGRPELVNLKSGSATTTLWQSCLAVPIVSETLVPLGAVTLHSTRPILASEEGLDYQARSSPDGGWSVIDTYLAADGDRDRRLRALADVLADTGRRAIYRSPEP